ncbi:MAG: MBL fold metallo-hydrolase [Clostridia bacterium]|nr:MBL fold metallo-hydrolase [Clostridia bacterium]
MTHRNCLHMLGNQTTIQMMSFVVETEDGKLIVIDGGKPGDAQHLLDTLRRLSGGEKPHVDAWFLTHNHIDHTGALVTLLTEQRDAFEVDAYYYNFPSDQFLTRYEPGTEKEFADFRSVQRFMAGRIETITQGDVYEFGPARFDVLYTTDPAFTDNVVNNSSSVLRMTLGGKTVLFLGDLGIEAGRKLLALHGNALRSDYVQMAHHGQNGVERAVYEAAAPSACLWCAPDWLWDNNAGKGYNTHTWQTVIVRGWMEEMGVKTHYVIKDGDHAIELK